MTETALLLAEKDLRDGQFMVLLGFMNIMIL